MRPSLSFCSLPVPAWSPRQSSPPSPARQLVTCHFSGIVAPIYNCYSVSLLPTRTHLEFSQRPVQSSPVQSAHPIPIRRERFWFNCLAIVNLKTKDIGYVNCLLCLPSCHTTHHRHTHPFVCCFCSVAPWRSRVSSFHARFFPVITTTTAARFFFTVKSPPFPHLSCRTPPQSPSLDWLCVPCCGSAVSWFDFFFFFYRPGIVAQSPQHTFPAQARLSQHSAVPCGSIGTFFSQSKSPALPLAWPIPWPGSHLPMELQVQVRL